MIFGDSFHLALRNLKQAKLRTALTTLGVSIGVGALACMVSLGVGLQEQFVGRFLKSGVFDAIYVFPSRPAFGRNLRATAQKRAIQKAEDAKASDKAEKPREVLDDATMKKMAALDRVKEVYPNLRIPAEVRHESFSEFSTAAGVPMSARGEGVFQNISHGSFFANDTEETCMLNTDFAKRITDKEPKDLLGKDLTLVYATPLAPEPGMPGLSLGGINLQRAEKKFRVLGIIEREPGPNLGGGALFSAVMIPLRKAQEMGSYDFSNPQALLQQLSERRTYVSVTVKVRRPQDTEEVEKKIKEMGFSAFSMNDALRGAKRAFILLDILLSLTGSVALAVASLGIMNTMVMSILERTREIGIMKAIGGSDSDIRKIFLVEASAIGLVGGLLGIILGWGVGRIINFAANLYITSQGGAPEDLFTLPWWLIAGGIAFAIVVSLLAGSYPASRAARLDPIQALRHD